jgi:hypothetical protein
MKERMDYRIMNRMVMVEGVAEIKEEKREDKMQMEAKHL